MADKKPVTKHTKTHHKTISDVTRPGSSKPSDSSRSLIITNRPVLKDPMVITPEVHQDNEADSSVQGPPPLAKRSPTGTLIKPISAAPSSSLKVVEPPAAKEVEEPEQEVVAEEVAPLVTKPEVLPEPTKDDEEVEPKAEADQVGDKREEEVKQLIESKQYFLPINSAETRRAKRFIVVGVILSLLLAAAWADIALDSGLIQISGVKPITHFFSN